MRGSGGKLKLNHEMQESGRIRRGRRRAAGVMGPVPLERETVVEIEGPGGWKLRARVHESAVIAYLASMIAGTKGA